MTGDAQFVRSVLAPVVDFPFVRFVAVKTFTVLEFLMFSVLELQGSGAVLQAYNLGALILLGVREQRRSRKTDNQQR
jgi:hypothetical protein